MTSQSSLPPSVRMRHLWPVADRLEAQTIDPAEPPTLAAWLPQATPTLRWDWPHLDRVRRSLEAVADGTLRRLMIFMPPRHGKSELSTVHYPAYLLETSPARRIIVGAYNSTLAEKFSRRTRAIVRRRGVALDPERQAVNDWLTTAGGGVRAVGVGGGVTGQGGDLIIIDDPVKSREEADSPTYRDKVWDWYRDDLYTRLEPGGAIILIMTRWHEDDLAGRILASERAGDWHVINLSALAGDDDPLGRAPGDALCPDRYDVAALTDIRATLGPRGWEALYQQRPRPPEGALLKRGWFPVVKALPAEGRRVRYWDIAGAAEGRGDYTVGCLMRRAGGAFYVEGVVRGQWTAAERERIIVQTAAADGHDVRIAIEQPPGLGKEPIEALVRALAGYAVHADRVTKDKVSRAEPLAAQAEAGNVSLLQGAYTTALLDELAAFPYGEHDDQVDAMSGAFNALATLGPRGADLAGFA